MSHFPTLPLAESNTNMNFLDSYNSNLIDQENDKSNSVENKKMQSENNENVSSKTSVSKTKLNVKIRAWNGVATWKWIANDDTCGICRVAFDGCCPGTSTPFCFNMTWF